MVREYLTKQYFRLEAIETYNYILKDSFQNAEQFKLELTQNIAEIRNNPTAFPPEPYLPTKNNLYRFKILMKSWKIIYKVTNEKLIFLSVFHTKQNPDKIKKLRTTKYE